MNKPLLHHHDGHRERMRERLKNDIGHTLADHELVEMLLYYVYPRCDTNEKAHIILEHFGGRIDAMVESDEQALIAAGLTPTGAAFFQLVREILRKYNLNRTDADFTFDNYDKLFRYSEDIISDPNREEFYVICFDSKGKRLCDVAAPVGVMKNVGVSMRKIVDIAVKNNAYAIVLVHNHPNGMSSASMEDIGVTKFIANILAPFNITVADHIIVSNGKAMSMRLKGDFDVKTDEDGKTPAYK